jgi:hypothetical protein
MTVDPLAALACKLECQDLIIRHGAALDRGDGAAGAALFVEDAKVSSGPGRADISVAEYWARPVEDFTFYRPRVITNIVITPAGPDTAEGSAYVTMRDVPDMAWRYEFRKTDLGWRIVNRWEQMITVPPHFRDLAKARQA